MKEIERKWLLKSLPSFTKNTTATLVEQSYLSMEPEVRIRMKYKLFAPPDYIMTIKGGNNDLVRDEDELILMDYQYNTILKSIGRDPIRKDYYRYAIDGTDLIFEVSVVDKGTLNQFYYVEVEFKTIEEAKKFNLPTWFINETSPVEVTYDQMWKMKNYWKRTRLGDK